ncbi:MAG TPA: DUF4268 domain-containing protein, partial [Nitrolancea sp.]|nr:DUF4268 domain-containing protein [Nitrolancea sp.]
DSKPGRGNWLDAELGYSGIWLNYIVRVNDARVELYISSRDAHENRQIFDQLYANKDKVESSLGQLLKWDNREGREICTIAMPVTSNGGYQDESRWPEVQEAMINAMIRFEEALRPFLSHVSTNS